jgi:hypothetical protein
MRESRRIEQNDGYTFVAGRVNSLDQLGLRITLKSVEVVAGGRCLRSQRRFDIGERRGAVDTGLATAELPQVRAVEQQQTGHRRDT